MKCDCICYEPSADDDGSNTSACESCGHSPEEHEGDTCYGGDDE